MKTPLFLFGAALAAFIVAALTGCAGGPNAQQVGMIVSEVIAKDATYLALKKKPEWRDEFEIARADLNTLAQEDTPAFDKLQEIVRRLPVKELKSEEAELLIGDLAILVKGFTPNQGEIIYADQTEKLRGFIVALRDGIGQGLTIGAPPVVPDPVPTP